MKKTGTKASVLMASFALSFSGITVADSNLVIKVEATRIRPVVTPDSTPLQDTPGLTLRQQGQGNPQTDLSIRGSSFSATGVTIQGLSLRNAQTEHWHASVTTPESWLEPPRVVTGLDRFRLSTGHPAGSVALSLAPLLSDENRVTLGGGNYGTVFGGAEATAVEHLDGSTVGASAFVSGHHSDQTDTVAGNYLDRVATGARLSRISEKTQADLLATIAHSQFGAQGFYGASPLYPSEEELIDSMVAGSLSFTGEPDEPASVGAAWRRTDDTYTLNRYKPSLYRNEHTTDYFTAHGARRTVLNDTLSLDSRADAELETIRSRSLGDHDRSRGSIALIPDISLGEWSFSAGGSAEFFSSDSTRFLPAAGMEWEFEEGHSLFVGYTEALRQPSYTELNYESPDSLGNSGLDRQHTRTTEAGYKAEGSGHWWKIALFYERATEPDWVKSGPGARWAAMNLDEIESYGAEAAGAVSLDDQTEISRSLLLLEKDENGEYYAGRYALDYPQMSSVVNLLHSFTERVTLRVSQFISKHESNPVREGGDWLADMSIDLQWQLPFAEQLALNAGVRNIFDDEFQYFPGQDSLGRSVYSSVTYSW